MREACAACAVKDQQIARLSDALVEALLTITEYKHSSKGRHDGRATVDDGRGGALADADKDDRRESRDR